LYAVLEANFGSMRIGRSSRRPDLGYSEIRTGTKPSFLLKGPTGHLLAAETLSEALWKIEKDLTVELQKARPDLLFLHAASIALEGRAFLLVAASGTGKSTLTLALTQCGFRYLTDELCAVDLDKLVVEPYAHALCMKRAPPAPCELTAATLDLGATLHVPVDALAGGFARDAMPIAGMFVLERDDAAAAPRARRLGSAEAAARLYAQALNPLAHPALGVDAVVSLASRVPCFVLSLGDIAGTSALLRDMLAPAHDTSIARTGAWSAICSI
jgi:hypothetical protein